MLEVRALSAGYARAQVLFDLSLSVGSGEVVALLGRNGAGKSTTLKTIAGLVRSWRGDILFDGERIDRLPSFRIARLGLGYVPEERRIFTDLTVEENLEVGRKPARSGNAGWTRARLLELFPRIAELLDRPAGRISGGEQQMLSIARTLMGNPRLLLLDEPSEGLAPLMVRQMMGAVREFKREGVAVLLSEQNYRFADAVADRAYVLEGGHLRFAGTLAEFTSDARKEYLGVD
jgi:branched-chain amino acid transport system ATP-binding protein